MISVDFLCLRLEDGHVPSFWLLLKMLSWGSGHVPLTLGMEEAGTTSAELVISSERLFMFLKGPLFWLFYGGLQSHFRYCLIV